MPTSGQILWGPEKIDLNILSQGSAFIGRSPDSQILLTHPGVSKKHAKISYSLNNYLLSDLGSRFGTRVNGKRIKGQVLKKGDRIEFGPIPYELVGNCLHLIKNELGASLKANNLIVERGNRKLLENVCVDVKPNQFVGVLGPSGSGKSTLIKCLASFLFPSSGSIFFDDLDLNQNLDFYRSIVGYVPQEDVVFLNLTGRQNFDYALRIRLSGDLNKRERTEIIDRVVENLGLQEHIDKPVRILSGGQRKRVNVGLDLLKKPKILFLDEPTSGLDPASETKIMEMLKQLASKGTTIICSTHIMENLHLFDQLIVVANKTVVYSDHPSGMLKHFKINNYAELYTHLESYDYSKKDSPVIIQPNNKNFLKHILGDEDLVTIKNKLDDSFPISTERGTNPGSFIDKILGGQPLVPINTLSCSIPIDENSSVKQVSINFESTIERSPFITQVVVLIERGVKVLLADHWFCILLIIQPVFIGFLINISQANPSKSNEIDSIFLFGLVTAIWLGLNNSAGEIIRDRVIYVRERFAGVTPEGYLVGKTLLFSIVGFFQILILVFILYFLNMLTEEEKVGLKVHWFSYITLVFTVTYIASLLLGFIISTLANSEETAIAVVPILVLPQLLLSTIAAGLKESRDGSLSSVAVILNGTEDSTRGFCGWLLELFSLAIYSRPSFSLFKTHSSSKNPVLIYSVDWVHLLFLLFFTASLLAIIFQIKEKHWIDGREIKYNWSYIKGLCKKNFKFWF